MLQQKVSIIVPVYNGERYILDTIESCLNQTYVNIEIVVADDGSNDNSVKLIESISHQDIRLGISFIFLKNENNLGLSRTINRAVNFCSGYFVLILGHDDVILPHHVSNMLMAWGEGDTSLVYCNASVIDSDGNLVGRKIYNDSKLESKNLNYLRNISIDNYIPSCGLLFKRKIFLEVGGWDEKFRNYGEWLLWIKLAHKGSFVFAKTDTALYRVHTQNISLTFKDEKVKKALRTYFSYCQKVALSYDLPIIERLHMYLYRMLVNLYRSLITNNGVFK